MDVRHPPYLIKIVEGTLLWQTYQTTIKILIGIAIGRASRTLDFSRESIVTHPMQERIGSDNKNYGPYNESMKIHRVDPIKPSASFIHVHHISSSNEPMHVACNRSNLLPSTHPMDRCIEPITDPICYHGAIVDPIYYSNRSNLLR